MFDEITEKIDVILSDQFTSTTAFIYVAISTSSMRSEESTQTKPMKTITTVMTCPSYAYNTVGSTRC